MKKVLLIIGGGIIIPFIFLGFIMFGAYKCGSDYREERAWEYTQFIDTHKYIIYENKFDSIDVYLDFYFNYSKVNSKDSLFIDNIDTNPSITNKDTIYITLSKSSGSYEILPIFKNDSIPFPESFSIKIHDRRQYYNDTILKELDYNSFKECAIPDGITNKNDFLLANKWTLVIDSTLLGLK